MMLSYIVLISNCLREETACLRPACHTVLTRIMSYDAILHRPHPKFFEGRNCLFKASMPHSVDKDNVV